MRSSNRWVPLGTGLALLCVAQPALGLGSARPATRVEAERIVVLANRGRGSVNPRVFGTNLLGYDPMTYETWADSYVGFSNFGEGLWDPQRRRPVPAMLDLLKRAGASVVRFPGGCGTHHYDWKRAVGAGRADFLFGIDEFLRVAEALGAEPVITLSYFTGDERTDAELVEYLNAPNNGRNPGGGIDWAAQRARNGHPEPYRVTFFEVGNEVWHGDHHGIAQVSADTYAARYLRYYEALKAIDPEVEIGVILRDDEWDRAVLSVVRDRFDFGVMHVYFSGGWAHQPLAGRDVASAFAAAVEEPGRFEATMARARARMREATGRDMPIAVTEYNTAFHQQEPVPYRHALGAALVNAEILRVLMNPDNRVLMANYWDFPSRFWGMVNTFQPVTQDQLTQPYVKRPNFYVFELYQQHFGDILLDAQTDAASRLSVNASRDADGARIALVVVNKQWETQTRAVITLMGFDSAFRGRAWVLNGPRLDATNEVKHDTVGVTERALEITGSSAEFAFEPHSLTVLEFTRKP
jgi:alpha-N-arabinofuranosidase